MAIEDYRNTTPILRPEEFLNAKLQGWGIVEPTIGRSVRRFTVDAAGDWDAERAILRFDEHWRFDDGHEDRLSWRIECLPDHRYRGQEERLKGHAEGTQAGAVFRWRYTREVPQKDGQSITLDFDDWFWRVDRHTVIVKGTAGRFGLPFATAHVTYRNSAL